MSPRALRDRAAIAGVGCTELSKASGQTPLRLAIRAVLLAVEDAGLDLAEVDGLACHHANDSAQPFQVAEALGMSVSWFHEEAGGGSKAPVVVGSAAAAVATGLARNVVVYRALNGRSGMRMGSSGTGGRRGAMGDSAYQVPYGLVAPAQAYAMAARQHMVRHGTTEEHLGTIAVQQRANAGMNDHALMRAPITMDDYLASRWVVEPFRLLDCCLETDGACAVVVTSTEQARDLRHPVTAISGWAAAIGDNGFSATRDGDLTTSSAALVAPRLWAMAGLGPDDVDVAQLYDAFTYSVLVQLEDYGFCAKGDAGPFVASGATALGGRLPVNTHGGFLSEGYVHGINHIAEAVRQLRGTAGARQVPDCRVALSTAQPGYLTGMSSAVLLSRP